MSALAGWHVGGAHCELSGLVWVLRSVICCSTLSLLMFLGLMFLCRFFFKKSSFAKRILLWIPWGLWPFWACCLLACVSYHAVAWYVEHAVGRFRSRDSRVALALSNRFVLFGSGSNMGPGQFSAWLPARMRLVSCNCMVCCTCSGARTWW